MSKIELKEELINKLKEIENERIIQSMLNIIELESNDLTVEFSNDQRNKIVEAKKSVRTDGIPNEEVFNKIQAWIEK